MPAPLELPGHELFVSEVAVLGTGLTVRLVSDYHPGSDPEVYVVAFEDVNSLKSAVAFLGRCKEENTYVYVARENAGVSFVTESGDRYVINALTVSSTSTTFNAAELTEVARRVYAWYLSENNALRAAQHRIETAQSLLVEFARRTEIKAASHGTNGTVTTLYSQLTLPYFHVHQEFDNLLMNGGKRCQRTGWCQDVTRTNFGLKRCG